MRTRRRKEQVVLSAPTQGSARYLPVVTTPNIFIGPLARALHGRLITLSLVFTSVRLVPILEKPDFIFQLAKVVKPSMPTRKLSSGPCLKTKDIWLMDNLTAIEDTYHTLVKATSYTPFKPSRFGLCGCAVPKDPLYRDPNCLKLSWTPKYIGR